MIYFIRDTATGLVKIGFSDSPRGRLAKMQVDCPGQLLLLATQEGGRRVESTLHERFAHLHVRGEWHRLGDDLDAHIGSLPPAGLSSPTVERARPKHMVLVESLCDATGVGFITARSWLRRKSIPGRYWLAISKAGVMSLEELAVMMADPTPDTDDHRHQHVGLRSFRARREGQEQDCEAA